nr:hypothetical protein [Tanacetum cinerariifolium]
MASFDYRLNPLYPNKECSSCGALYTTDYCCSERNLGDKIICDLDKTPDLSQQSSQNCPKCRNPVDGHYFRGCALLRKKLKEDLFTYCIENRILQDSSKPSNDNTNIVNALQEPFVVKQDPGKKSSQSPPQINHHCCYECGEPLEDIFCHECTCELCGRGAHYGYNCLPKVLVVSNPEPCYNQIVDELPQSLPSFDSTCYSEDGNLFTYDSTYNLVHDSPNVFDPPSQPPFYSCEFCGNDARYGHSCTPQVPFIYPEPCYNQDFNFPQDFHDFQQQYLCCENCGLMEQLTSMCDMVGQYIQKKEEEKQIEEEQAAKTRYWKIPTCYDDDDEDYAIAVTPSLSTEEPDNSLSMGDEHLDTISATKSDKFIKSSVENLVPIPSESKGIPDYMCDVPFHDNSPPLDISKDQFENFSDSNNDSTSIDDDSFSIDNIEYVEASPLDSELVNLVVMEIVILELGGIDDDILLTIKDDILHEKLLNVNLLIANIESLNDNPTPSSDLMTKSSSTSLNSLLEETNTFDNSLPELETFCFDLEEISSGKISSGSTTTHSNSSLYDSFIFDLSINPFPPADRSDFYEFADELAHNISPPEYDCFCFKNEPNSGDSAMDVVEDIFPTREPRVHDAFPTHLPFQLNLDFILFSESLFAYVVWIFLPFLSYLFAPQYLLSFGNEDTIFDPGICSYHIYSFMSNVSHRSGTFMKINVHPKHLNESPMEISFFTCSPMDQ